MMCDVHTKLDACPGRATLVPSGPINESEVDDFASALQVAVCSGAQEIDVDLAAVPEMAPCVLDVLRGTIDTLSCVHGHLCLRNPTPQVQELLAAGALAS